MNSSNLTARLPIRQGYNSVKTPRLLSGIFRRHDAKRVADALHLEIKRVYQWVAEGEGRRRDPVETFIGLILALRQAENPRADDLVLVAARALDYSVFRNTTAVDDARFATVVREFADVMQVRADVDSDGIRTPGERRSLALKARELAEGAIAYAVDQERIANEEEELIPARRRA